MSKPKAYLLPTVNLQNVLLFLLAALIGALWYYLEAAKVEGNYPTYLVAIFWVLILIFALWLGNLLIYRLVQLRYTWESSFNVRFFLQLLLNLVYSLVCINASYIIFKNHFTELPPTQDQLFLLNIYGTLFLIPVISIQFGLLFSHKWKQSIVKQEKLEREQVHSELITLRSHLSPHFLFNTLNILSFLIRSDNYEAQDYLEHFAEVYRYVLKNGEVELIALREELQFIEAYTHLLSQRFTNSLQIITNIANGYQEYLIPPLAIQMLLENALKHNRLSESVPLKVEISSINMPAIVVENNLHPREVDADEKTGFGLENIRRRYFLTANRDIVITQTADSFKVTLPLIVK